MTEPPESATDEHSETTSQSSDAGTGGPRSVVGPVETFTRVDPVESVDEAANVEPVEVVDSPPITTLEEIDAAATVARFAERSAVPEVPSRSTSSWWRYGFPAAMVVLVLAIPSLVWIGAQVLLDSDDGRVVAAVTDPTAPGWEAVVDPTPVHTIAVTDENGDLDHFVLQFLTGSNSGGVVVVPAETVFDSGAYGDIPLSQIFAGGGGVEGDGTEAVRGALQSIVGIGIDEIQTVSPDEWGSLVSPVAPLTVNNPDDVVGADAEGGVVEFPKGSLQIPASDTWSYLSARSEGEDPINRMYRIEAFWRGWLGAVNAAGDSPDSVPGEIDSGLGYFVRSLAKGATEVTTLPVASMIGPVGETWFDPQPSAVRGLIASLDPFPAGPLGERMRVRVLDGTGDLDHGLAVANVLAVNGAQIDKVGNALNFDQETTQFVYYDPAVRAKVEALRDALGVGELVLSDELNVSEDVTVVLGRDALGVSGPSGGVVVTPGANSSGSASD